MLEPPGCRSSDCMSPASSRDTLGPWDGLHLRMSATSCCRLGYGPIAPPSKSIVCPLRPFWRRGGANDFLAHDLPIPRAVIRDGRRRAHVAYTFGHHRTDWGDASVVCPIKASCLPIPDEISPAARARRIGPPRRGAQGTPIGAHLYDFPPDDLMASKVPAGPFNGFAAIEPFHFCARTQGEGCGP